MPSLPFSDGEPNGERSLVPNANSPMTSAPSTPAITSRNRSASEPPSIFVQRPPSSVQRIGASTWPGRPIPSMTPSTTIVPSVRSSTAANATSAHRGTGPIICPRFLIGVTSSAGRPSIETVRSVPFSDVTRQSFLPSSTPIASRARLVASSIMPRVSSQSPMPSSTDAIFPFAAHVSRTALTWAKRFAHSRFVRMITSSELVMAVCRLRGGAIGKRVSARPRATWASLFMITGQAPRSTQTLATVSACSRCSSSQMMVTTSSCSTDMQTSTTSSASLRSVSTAVAMEFTSLARR